MIALRCSKKAINEFENQYFRMLIGGVHEYFRFYDFNTQQERLNLLEKIASDQRVKSYKARKIKGLKNKALLILLKMGKYTTILKIFEKHYKK